MNYRSGLRLFDSSVFIEDKGSGGKAFDSALIQGSGWGQDPVGMFRANIERDGWYRLDAQIRRVRFFNNLNNHAIGDTLVNFHNYNTRRNLGDFDLTILPSNQDLRLRFGGSYNLSDGPFTYTTRQSDAFLVDGDANTKAYDLRAGADGRILGFNLTFTYGYRNFRNRSTLTITNRQEGDRINNYDLLTFDRSNPVDGRTHHGVLSVQRTFAKRFDFTARILHSMTSTDFRWDEFQTFYYNTTTVVLTDQLNITGQSSRPQTRGDLGMTWRVTDQFRVSNTFTFDGFNLNGGNIYLLEPARSVTKQSNYTITRYRRYTNLVEGDYQFNNLVGLNVGYRYTKREFALAVNSVDLATTPPTPLEPHEGDGENVTHTIIAGAKIKPTKNLAIYADVEKGKADTVFTRAGNADFTNFRIRSILSLNKVSANLSFITKDNEIPTDTVTSTVPRITDISSRTFAASIDWNPIDSLNLAGGYNYLHLTSRATVDFSNLADVLSEYFVRDNYFYIDATVRPHRRFTVFGSYRWNKDRGHGNRPIPALGALYVLGSYPIDVKTPEVKASVRLNKYLDWSIGYQYHNYKEDPIPQAVYGLPLQNYSAHMPYTSLRIYLGKGAVDR